MVIGVDIMALVKTHLYSFYSMQTNATDPKTLIELLLILTIARYINQLKQPIY